MAGFRRLCGRFRCVGGSMAHGGAEGAKFRRLGVCGALFRLVGRVGVRREQRAHAHE